MSVAQTVIGLFKPEVIHRRGLWRSFDALEYATLEWVDWFLTAGYWSRSATSRQPRQKRTTTRRLRSPGWLRNSQPK
jgi:hypothetical protein